MHAAALVSLALAGCASKPALKPPGAPPALRVAKNEIIALEAFGSGVQRYACNGAGQWIPKGPEAELADREGRKIGTVSAGPTWEVRGAKVTGSVRAEEPGRTSDDLAWALFAASSAPRGGALGRTSSIQRMDTVGGAPPGGACTEGGEVRVPFKATYYFYRQRK
jgi:hypothetical protein